MLVPKSRIQKGFTLVELLIVVIILAILAAIVVPQFASSTDDAKLSSLDSNLTTMRSAIELYYHQHSANYPGAKTAIPTACGVTAPVGTGDASDAAKQATAFIEQLTLYTDVNGQACGKKDTTYKFGPYLKKATLPENPITSKNALAVVSAGALGLSSGISDGTGGWKYDNLTGQFIADDDRTIPNSSPATTYDAR